MQLSELYLNRYLYRDDQDSQTPDALYVSSNATDIPSNFVAYGGNSAIDVNTNTTTINGGKIRTGDVESTGYKYVSGIFSNVGMQINLDTGAITSVQFAIDSAGNAYFKGDISGASGTFTGNITVGTGNNVFKVFSGTGMWLGNAVFGSAPFRVDMAGNVTASSVTMTNASISTGSTWSGNQIANAYIGNLNANKITTGTLTVGDGISQATILINQSTGGGGGSDAFLRWSGGSRIWSDGSNDMGFNAIGGDMIFYGNSNQMVQFSFGNQAVFGLNGSPTGILCHGNFNVGLPGGTTYDSRFNGGYVYFSNSGGNSSIYGGNSNRMEYNASTYHYFNIGGNLRLQLSDTGLVQYSSNGAPLLYTNWIRATGPSPAIGAVGEKWIVHCNALSACPLPITAEALTKLKTLKHKKLGIGEGHYGDEIDYLDIPDAISEMKTSSLNKETGIEEEDIDIIKTVAFLYSCIKELQEEVELLKSK